MDHHPHQYDFSNNETSSYFGPSSAKRGRYEQAVAVASQEAHVIEMLQQENMILKQRIEELKKQVVQIAQQPFDCFGQ